MVDVRTDYRVGLKDETKKGIASIQKGLAGINKSFAALGAGISVAGITAFTVKAAESADRMNKLSDRLNISTEELSKFGFVAKQSGLEFNTFGVALQRAIRRVADAADGTGPAVDAFKELGLNAKQLKTLKPDQTFEAIAEALSQVEDEYKRVSLAQKVFDSEGVALLQTMTNGAQGIRDLKAEFESFGGVLDSATADIGSELVDAFGRLDASGQALGNNLLRVLGPTLADLVNTFAAVVPKAVAFTFRSFEGLRSVIAALIRDVANFVGLEDIAKSFDNVSKDAAANVIQLRDAMADFGKQTEQAKNAADFLQNSLGNFEPTSRDIKAAADQAKLLAAELRAVTEAEREFAQAFDAANQKLAQQEAALLSVATPAEEFKILVAQYKREQEDFGISAEVTARRVTAAYERLTEDAKESVTELSEETMKLLENISSEVDRFSNSLVDSVFDSSKSIGDIFADLGIQIGKSLFKSNIADPLSGFFKDGLSNLFAGGFATGGFIPPGQFGVVGENGPEIAFGGRAGQTITPTSGGGSVNVTVINNNGSKVETRDRGVSNGRREIELVLEGTANQMAGRGRGLPTGPGLIGR